MRALALALSAFAVSCASTPVDSAKSETALSPRERAEAGIVSDMGTLGVLLAEAESQSLGINAGRWSMLTIGTSGARFAHGDSTNYDVQLVSSLSCPQIAQLGASLTELALPSPGSLATVGGDDDLIRVVGDGADVRVRMGAHYRLDGVLHGATLEIGGDLGTPVSDWYGAAIAAIRPCFSDSAPGN